MGSLISEGTLLEGRIEGRKLAIKEHGAGALAALDARFAPLVAAFKVAGQEQARIAMSPELAPQGKDAALMRLREKSTNVVQPLLAAIRAALVKETTDVEAEALALGRHRLVPIAGGGYKRTAEPERTVEVLMAEQEIRAHFRGEDRRELGLKYLAAVVEESDETFVSALEHAPKSVAMLDDVTRAQGDEIRLSRSPDAAAIYARRAVLDASIMLLEMAESEFYALFPGVQPRGETPLARLPQPPSLPVGVEMLLKKRGRAA